MRILIFLFLSMSCLIYYGNAAGNSNQVKLASAEGEATIRHKRDADGGETEQDPNDPKYQKMAKELVLNHLRIKEEDAKNIKVNKVTTQVVAGIVTRIEIKVTLVSGNSDTCNFEVWERISENVKHVTFKCLIQNKVLSGISSKPHPKQTRDPKDPKYQQLAKASIDSLFQTAENKPFKKEDISKITVTKVKVQIGSKIMNYLVFNVITVNNNTYQCTSTISEKPWDPQETAKVSEVTCELAKRNSKLLLSLSPSKLNLPGGEVDKDPNDPKYQSLAKISFQQYLDANRDVIGNVQVKSIKIDSVTSQVVAGTNIRMHFRVNTLTQSDRFLCQAKIFETLSGHYSDFNVSCNINIGGEEDQDPDDPQYQQLAIESFKFYLKPHRDNVQVKRIKIDSVTTQVVAGMITRIQFDVYPTRGSRFKCQSKIFEKLGPGRNLEFDVKCHRIDGGEEEKDPDDPQYQQLAIESFKFYLKSHKDNVQVKRIKVDSVTTQVVAGMITRIQFDVYPTRGSRFDCQSEIFEKLGPAPNLEFDVKCHRIDGGEEEKDPNEPQFQQLAKESFRKYRQTHIGPLFVVKELKVTRATTQVVAGLITRLDFYVTTTEGGKLTCHSNIFQKSWKGIKNIHVNCKRVRTGDNVKKSDDQLNQPGGIVYKNPDDPHYQHLANESFQRYLNSHHNVTDHVDGIKVDSVSSQLVAGTIIRIHFHVYLTRVRFVCKSKIFEELSGQYLDFDVSCHKETGNEEEQDPDDPQFQRLAKESFKKYQETHTGPQFMDKGLKVTRVTIEALEGLYTQLDFYVITTEGGKLTCHSTVFEQWWNKYKTIDVNCNRVPTDGVR